MCHRPGTPRVHCTYRFPWPGKPVCCSRNPASRRCTCRLHCRHSHHCRCTQHWSPHYVGTHAWNSRRHRSQSHMHTCHCGTRRGKNTHWGKKPPSMTGQSIPPHSHKRPYCTCRARCSRQDTHSFRMPRRSIGRCKCTGLQRTVRCHCSHGRMS